jgi:serine/threonine protein kinase
MFFNNPLSATRIIAPISFNKNMTGAVKLPLVGRKVGKLDEEFRVIGELGKGCFGKVFKAKNSIDGKICALKITKKQILATGEAKIAEKEITNWKKLSNRMKNNHLVKLYEAWQENGYLYSSSEY